MSFKDETVCLTREMIQACKTRKGGFTRDTLKAFGISWPPKQGWPHRIEGMTMTNAQYRAAMIGAGLISEETEEIQEIPELNRAIALDDMRDSKLFELGMVLR